MLQIQRPLDPEHYLDIVARFGRLSLIEDLTWKERIRRHGDWVQRHREFHAALVAACDGQWLLRLRSLMFNQLERCRFLSKLGREKSRQSNGAQYRALMEAALARDPKKAARLREQHIRGTSAAAVQSLD